LNYLKDEDRESITAKDEHRKSLTECTNPGKVYLEGRVKMSIPGRMSNGDVCKTRRTSTEKVCMEGPIQGKNTWKDEHRGN
jgi:hypothetical protein